MKDGQRRLESEKISLVVVGRPATTYIITPGTIKDLSLPQEITSGSFLMEKIAVATCGVSVAGKTTFALNLSQLPNTVAVHSDWIRAQLGISTLTRSQEEREQVYSQVLLEIQKALLRVDLVVIDAALTEQCLRCRVLNEIQKLVQALVLIVFPVPSLHIASVRQAKKKRLFRLTCNPIYTACRMENFFLSKQRFEKPSEEEIGKIVARGAYMEFGDSPLDTRIEVNESLFSSWQKLEIQILRAYKDVVLP